MSRLRARFRLSDPLATRLHEVHGDAARAWSRRFETELAELCARWGLEVGEPFADPSYAWVAPVRRAQGSAAVLKATFPGREFRSEAAALAAFAGRGAVRLLAEDARGFLLLERLRPGAALALDDRAATLEALIAVLHALPPCDGATGFPDTRDQASGLARLRARFEGGSGPFPAALLSAAESRFRELDASRSERRLLHGDLHPGNVLSARRAAWLAIDPKGVCGDTAWECGAYLRNLARAVRTDPAAPRRLALAIVRLADGLGLARERIAASAAAQAVLSAWWSFEDHGRGHEAGLAAAALLDAVAR